MYPAVPAMYPITLSQTIDLLGTKGSSCSFEVTQKDTH